MAGVSDSRRGSVSVDNDDVSSKNHGQEVNHPVSSTAVAAGGVADTFVAHSPDDDEGHTQAGEAPLGSVDTSATAVGSKQHSSSRNGKSDDSSSYAPRAKSHTVTPDASGSALSSTDCPDGAGTLSSTRDMNGSSGYSSAADCTSPSDVDSCVSGSSGYGGTGSSAYDKTRLISHDSKRTAEASGTSSYSQQPSSPDTEMTGVDIPNRASATIRQKLPNAGHAVVSNSHV